MRRLKMWMRDEKGAEAILRVSGWVAESKAQRPLPAPSRCLAGGLPCSLLRSDPETASIPSSL